MCTINIGDFNNGEETYHNRCLSASIGGSGVESETIPWAGTEYNPWDYKYENEEFVLAPIFIPLPPPEPPSPEERIAELEAMLDALLSGRTE